VKNYTLAALIFLLSACLYDATQLSERYAAAIAACANGTGFVMGNTIVACVPIEVPRKEATTKRM